MSKLDELKAAWEAADATEANAWSEGAAADWRAAWDARRVAWFAYRAELEKTKEENSDDY